MFGKSWLFLNKTFIKNKLLTLKACEKLNDCSNNLKYRQQLLTPQMALKNENIHTLIPHAESSYKKYDEPPKMNN